MNPSAGFWLNRKGEHPHGRGRLGMSGNVRSELTPRQRAAVVAVVTQPTFEDAAKVVRITTRQLRRYMGMRPFRAELSRLQGEALALAAGRLAGLLGTALDVVGRALAGEPTTSRQLYAARLVLAHVADLVEFASLEERITALEGIVNERENAG